MKNKNNKARVKREPYKQLFKKIFCVKCNGLRKAEVIKVFYGGIMNKRYRCVVCKTTRVGGLRE